MTDVTGKWQREEIKEAEFLPGIFAVEGYGMVFIPGYALRTEQLWLPFEPTPVQMRLM